MVGWSIIAFICTIFTIINAKSLTHQKRDAQNNICEEKYNDTSRIQCYCSRDNHDTPAIKFAECYLTVPSVSPEDKTWDRFVYLKNAQKITFTNTRGVPLTYVPTKALKHADSITRFEIKYAVINTIFAYAFSNISHVEEFILRDNQITTLEPFAFAHHKNLNTISLDTNNLEEINRNVFVDLPQLKKLYLTSNKISTIHDRAFINLTGLKELEIDRNKVFSLNFATFEGLVALENLDLSSNSLEVIGDNTFSALKSLKSLNLEGNKIQMLDEKAFNGLGELISLSLARNKIISIENEKVFEGLNSLTSLSLRGNQIEELKTQAMTPILRNLYGSNSSLDIEDNGFPCDCRLDWFMSLMNKTLSKHLKITLENLKCLPDPTLKEKWTRAAETEKLNQQVSEDEESKVQETEYEYYDDTQLNGKLFYLDVRDLLLCNKDSKSATDTVQESVPTKEESSPLTNNIATNEAKSDKNKREFDDRRDITTNRLATVSAKPIVAKIYEDMASDEAKPENKIKAHRSIQEEKNPHNGVERNLSSVVVIALFIFNRCSTMEPNLSLQSTSQEPIASTSREPISFASREPMSSTSQEPISFIESKRGGGSKF